MWGEAFFYQAGWGAFTNGTYFVLYVRTAPNELTLSDLIDWSEDDDLTNYYPELGTQKQSEFPTLSMAHESGTPPRDATDNRGLTENNVPHLASDHEVEEANIEGKKADSLKTNLKMPGLCV